MAAAAELTLVDDVTPCIDTAEDLDNRMADLTSNIKEQLEFIKKVANESALSASAFIHFMMKKFEDAKSERDKIDSKLQTLFCITINQLTHIQWLSNGKGEFIIKIMPLYKKVTFQQLLNSSTCILC